MNGASLSAPRNQSNLSARSMSSSQPGLNTNRQAQLSANRPPSAMTPQSAHPGPSAINNSNRPNGAVRSWSAQGNSTDSGRAPQGFGSSNRPATSPNTSHVSSANRPPWAGSYNGAAPRNSANRSPSNYGSGGRSYTPPASNGRGGYSAPHYSSAAPHGYSTPHYAGPSAPHSYGGPAGGGYHGGGGGSSHGGGGGGGSHGGHH